MLDDPGSISMAVLTGAGRRSTQAVVRRCIASPRVDPGCCSGRRPTLWPVRWSWRSWVPDREIRMHIRFQLLSAATQHNAGKEKNAKCDSSFYD
jgi:hypothetical protein